MSQTKAQLIDNLVQPITGALGSASAPTFSFTTDPNTGIYSPGADQLAISTGGSGRVFVDSSGNVGFGASDPGYRITSVGNVAASASPNYATLLNLRNGNDGGVRILASNNVAPTLGAIDFAVTSTGVGTDDGRIQFSTATNGTLNTAVTIDSSQRVGIGTTSPAGPLHVQGTADQIRSGDGTTTSFLGGSGGNGYTGTLSNHRFDFYTNSQLRATIDTSGRLLVGTSSVVGTNGQVGVSAGTNEGIAITNSTGATRYPLVFLQGTTFVGSVSTTGSATAYNTSSDYRLKENVVAVTDGITRLQQLNPCRFNFLVDPDTTVDGFIAHEVQTVVPEAITGEKDAVDDDGNPIYQGIDQSKLVPLLTAALQEAIGEIESLKARVAALESA